ncbi:sushi, von Willebrand factor type A, EGF and pentraxin domain-containing protein 1-like [Haliotis asinina]|uniref:sushi, von Willebrand factor type A, EGF and pentraxin domain-containing protein 1-like n=1 Tax=Haliotis asinina TaxID=109174 RepID=UPI0035322766
MLLRGVLFFAFVTWTCYGCHRRHKFFWHMKFYRPTIRCPRVQKTYVADPGQDTAKVTWGEPVVQGKRYRVQMITAKESGSSFGEGAHKVVYMMRDHYNIKRKCHMKFKVKVLRCPMLRSPANGRINCEGNKYGDICTFSCQKGHLMIGLPRITCLQMQFWSGHPPNCEAHNCGSLTPPAHALPFKCDKGHSFGSVCLLQCDTENGWSASKGLMTRCTHSGQWTETNFQCKDTEPPMFINCPTQTIHQSESPGTNSTSVLWPKLTVTDNSNIVGSVQAPPGVTVTGGMFAVGTHIVKFNVQDGEGNKAEPCSFVVKVERVECEPPSLDDEHMKIPGCVPPFAEGNKCKLECGMDIPLKGSSYITCSSSDTGTTGTFWDWGQKDTPPRPKPYCEVPKCPKLSAPAHGAVACDKWLGGQMCSVLCQKGYDVPGDFEKYYICPISSGKWTSDNVPGCEPTVPGWGQTLPAAYIFNGPCKDAEKEVKTNFIDMLKNNNLCSGKYCIVQNVNVTCGSSRKRRGIEEIFGRVRRGASINFIVFEINLMSEESPLASAEQVAAKTIAKLGKIATAIKNRGTFSVAGQKIRPLTVRKRSPSPVCNEGFVRARKSKNACVACPRGTFYNSSKQCESCQKGSYQDRPGSVACVSCPSGHITLNDGRNTIADCVELCRPGYYSPTGLTPCSGCPPGTYQPQEGGASCIACPPGMRTQGNAAKFLLECIPSDILLQGPVTVAMPSTYHEDVCEFTFSVWVKVVYSGNSGLKFGIHHPQHGTQLSINLASSIDISTASDVIRVDEGLNQTWSHVALSWNMNSVHVFQDGRQVRHQRPSILKCPLPRGASLTINLENEVYALIQNLNVIPSSDLSVVKLLSTSCEASLNSTLFSLHGLNFTRLDRVFEVTPSTCLQNDACKEKPCGDHICVPTTSSFRCVCKGGYSGDRCKQAPDYCIENQCSSGSTCLSDTTGGYRCLCPGNTTGMLCQENTIEQEWAEWGDWEECSKTCGAGFRVRRRFCISEDAGVLCEGKDTQSKVCQLEACPDCREGDLQLGRGVSSSCTKDGDNITCTIHCVKGLVFTEEPVNYTCKLGEWEPDMLTQSCTAPQTPWTIGVKYSVLLQTEMSVNNARDHLLKVGSSFDCVKNKRCRHDVKVKACDGNTVVCKKYGGKRFGQINLLSDVQPAPLNLSDVLQTDDMPSFGQLFNTWQVLQDENTNASGNPDTTPEEHTETGNPDDRELGVQVQGLEVLLYSRSNRSRATRVSGEFGRLLSAWHDLDKSNWEIRRGKYSAFKLGEGEDAPHVVTEQEVTCPDGSAPGGLFCVKCAPGTFFSAKMCHSCSQGFYQDQEGQMDCKPCPGFSTTSLIGASSQASCKAYERLDQYILMTNGQNTLTKLHINRLDQKRLGLSIATGSVSLHAYSDDFIYYCTESPATIRKIKWDGSQPKLLMTLDAEITGLALDSRSGIAFFTLSSGSLRAGISDLDTDMLILDGLDNPRDLVISQEKFTMYWIEHNTIMMYRFGQKKRTPLLTRDTAIWGLKINEEANKLTWFAEGRVYSAGTDGKGVTKVMEQVSALYGRTEDYYFYVDSEGRLVRVSQDGVTKAVIMALGTQPKSVSVISKKTRQWRHQLCKADTSCRHACWQTSHFDKVCLRSS